MITLILNLCSIVYACMYILTVHFSALYVTQDYVYLYHFSVRAKNVQKFCVWLCWRGWWPLTTHWRGPTTDSHGDSWLLSFPPGPVRPSLVNLTPPGSPGGPMLMQALVRTPDQHEPVTNRSPLLKTSNWTCLLVARLQEHATAPGNCIESKFCCWLWLRLCKCQRRDSTITQYYLAFH